MSGSKTPGGVRRSRSPARRTATRVWVRGAAAAARPAEWAAKQDASTRRGTAIGWWTRSRGIDGPLQSLLLTTYIFLAILPAMLVFAEYMDSNPASLADHMIRQYGLNGSAAGQLRAILVSDRQHELGSALIAIVAALFFGLGFGRVLQHVYADAWRITVRETLIDQFRYAAALLVLFGMIALLELQTKELSGASAWKSTALAPV